LSNKASLLLGYTREEIKHAFERYIRNIALQNKTSTNALIDGMEEWYDGYQFSDDETQPKIYNPYSVLLFLSSGKLLSYWFETGTPTFLINLIKTKHFPIMTLDTIAMGRDELGAIEIDDIPVSALLFQTGYLTIRSYDPESGNYHLGFPNFEVKFSLLKNLLKQFTKTSAGHINDFVTGLTKALMANKIDLFCRLLQTFFADIPSGIQIPHIEKYYQTILYVLLKLLGITVNVEVMTNIGRIDCVIETPTHIYIFEFKMHKSPQEALHQIEEKGYHQKYLILKKSITLIGIKFDNKKRNLDEWIIKVL